MSRGRHQINFSLSARDHGRLSAFAKSVGKRPSMLAKRFVLDVLDDEEELRRQPSFPSTSSRARYDSLPEEERLQLDNIASANGAEAAECTLASMVAGAHRLGLLSERLQREYAPFLKVGS